MGFLSFGTYYINRWSNKSRKKYLGPKCVKMQVQPYREAEMNLSYIDFSHLFMEKKYVYYLP